MAANMQQMAAAAHMMPQQQQQLQHQQQLQMRRNVAQYQAQIFTRLSAAPVPAGTWQSTVSINDRMGKTMELYVPLPSFPPSPSAFP